MSNRKFFLIFGVISVCGLLLFGLVDLYFSTRAANRVKGLTPVTVAVLTDSRPGREVLVEGHVSYLNPVQLQSHGFVAYILEEREIYTDDEGTPEPGSWSVSERVTPPLLLELSDGLVQIENDDYGLRKARVIEKAPFIGSDSDTRYIGIKGGDAVIAVSVVGTRAELPQIKADFIARGTQASYVASLRSGGVTGFVLSVVAAVALGIFMMWDRVSGLLSRRRRRRIR